MANYNELKASIEQQIRSNGNQEITGDILQGILLGMLNLSIEQHDPSEVVYGVEWDVTNPDPAMTRIGNMALHRQLPIQNRMKGCLLSDDGEVVEYLNPTNWGAHALDGSRGQVMVELPEHYRKFETEGNIRRCKMSEYPLPGFNRVPKMYISAYEATVQRSTNKLASVKNMSEDYRGGNNNASYDGAFNTLLGRPASVISRSQFRTQARNRKPSTSEWNCLDYNAYKAMFWLFYVEYANKNCQAAYNSAKDPNGFSQGGLGSGITNISSSVWITFKNMPFMPCGYTDDHGNMSASKVYYLIDGSGSTVATTYATRYRGIENPFGHIWKIMDGVNVLVSPSEANGGDGVSRMYVAEDPSYYQDANVDGYNNRGSVARGYGYVSSLVLGESGDILPVTVVESESYWRDRTQATVGSTEEMRIVMAGGVSTMNAEAGLCCFTLRFNSSMVAENIGSRLCFIPQNS